MDDEVIRQAAQLARSEARPITDVRASAEYRGLLITKLVERAVRLASERARIGIGGQR
jgi:CO/xanthine dehydrogenase FAD-binding subunit